MPDYRLYRLSVTGRIVSAPIVFTSTTDEEAIQHSQQFRDGADMELWERSRRVMQIPKLSE